MSDMTEMGQPADIANAAADAMEDIHAEAQSQIEASTTSLPDNTPSSEQQAAFVPPASSTPVPTSAQSLYQSYTQSSTAPPEQNHSSATHTQMEDASVPTDQVATGASVALSTPAAANLSTTAPPPSAFAPTNGVPTQASPSHRTQSPQRSGTPTRGPAEGGATTVGLTAAGGGFPIPPANSAGSATRVYLNKKVTPFMVEGMKWVAKNEPEKPLKWLGEYLLKKSREVEGE